MVDQIETRGWAAINRTLRPVALIGIASLVSGAVVGGVGGRIVMTIAARAAGAEMAGRLTENGNTIGVFTVGGTITLVVFVGILGGMIGSVGVVAADPWLRWMGPWRGIGFGLVVLALFGYDTFASSDFLILEPAALDVALFLILLIGFGLGVTLVNRMLERRLPEASDREQILWVLVVALGGIPLLLSLLFFTTPSFCGCEPAHDLGLALLVMILSTGVHHLSKAGWGVPGWLGKSSSITGYLSLAAALALGLTRTIENLLAIF